MHTYTIFNADDYFKAVTSRIAKAAQGERVALITMVFEPSEQLVKDLLREVIAAAERGVRVHLVIDAHSFMLSPSDIPTGPMYWRRDILTAKRPRHFFDKVRLLESLRRAGGHYAIINQPTAWPTNPFAGRSHIKATVIGDEAYVGGCNLGHTGQIDYMVRLRHATAADWIYKLILHIATDKSAWRALEGQDCKLPLDGQTTLLVDAGVPGQSHIFQEALQCIDQAKQWLVITCQFLPNGVISQHLAQAHARGVRIYSIFNHPAKHSNLTPLAHYLIRGHEKRRYPPELFTGELPRSHQRLHAKLIATESLALIGSHNYVATGVRLGTAEIALLRREPSFAREALLLLLPQLVVPPHYPLPHS